MIKNLLLSFAIVFFVLGVIYIIVMADIQADQLNWPAWVYIIASLIAFVLFFEILTRLVPKRFETPISLFRKYDVHDQRVVGVAIFVFLVLISVVTSFPLATTISYKWFWWIGFVILFFVPWLILFVFGSEKIKHGVSTESFRNATARDKAVRLFALLAQYIIMVYPLAITSDLFLIFVCFSIAPFIKIPIFLIFGSQELRESVIPQWIKKVINKSQ